MISTLLLCSMLAGCLPMAEVQAANKELSIETAKSMALSQSMDYQKLQSQLALAKGDYADSIRSIKEKERNQKTFRWSPLLNFIFPEKPVHNNPLEIFFGAQNVLLFFRFVLQ